MNHRYSILIGNGVSLAYNPQLGVANLTTELQTEFENLGATAAEVALTKLAKESRRDPSSGFESMLGPLETTARSLEALSDLTPLAASTATAAELLSIRSFVEAVHRTGLSIVLGKIAALSTGVGGAGFGAIEDFARGVADLAEPHRLCVATLNYDGLTHAGLLKHGNPADLAHGFQNHSHTVVPGRKRIEGFALRQSDDIPDYKTPLIQLHGSLGWLRHPETGSILRFTLDDLRAIDYWSEWAAGNTNWSPVVVLTDQKERTIVRRPFALAYDIFQQRLIASDRWLIAGYGLGDAPVNELFRTAWATRVRLDLPEPELLVVDYGLASPTAHRAKVAELLAVPIRRIVVSNEGVPDVIGTQVWSGWAN